MEEKRLFLLDAYALIYRAYYALMRTPRVTSKGLNTSAIFGFCNTLDDILRRESPTHIAVCFDPPHGRTFRHEMYAEYKAQRDKQPEDITLSIPYIKRILEAYRIPAIEVDGYEADDVIGTLACMAEREGFTTYMMTPDKDYGQLVTDKVFMYRPALRGEGFEVRGPEQVCERYGISSPKQVIDLLALEGDASDNVPGCPGVGEKTAVKLINEFGSVENLVVNTDQLRGALKKKVEENVDKIRFSKELVTIKTDVPLGDVTPDGLIRKPENTEALIDVYRELEFRTFMKRLATAQPAEEESPVEVPSATASNPLQGSLFDFDNTAVATVDVFSPFVDRPHKYTVADGDESVAKAVACAMQSPRVGLAMADTGGDAMNARLTAIAIAPAEGEGVLINIPTENGRRAEVMALLTPLFETESVEAVGADVKRMMLLLRHEGVVMTMRYFDVSVAHYLINPEKKHDLQILVESYLGCTLPSVDKSDFCVAAADASLQLYKPLSDKIAEENMAQLAGEVEMPMVRVLADMEWTGVQVDTTALAELSREYTARLVEMENEVYALAGSRFNLSSPMQVGEVLFGRMAIDPKAKRTKRGSYSTTEEILEKYRATHPIVDLILRVRALRKLLSTYVNALPALVNQTTGKIHTSYNQTVTATGRLSSTNPNLQNIPVRSEDGRGIRKAFIPGAGRVMLAADYSQIELRLMADMSGDEGMIDAFLSGADFHRATAAKIYHEELDDVTDAQRRAAKTANFGIIYGISAFGLSERLSIPRQEAKELIQGYFATYPGVQEYMDRCIASAREKGYVSTVMGRRRMLPDINSRSAVVRGYAERNAVNAPLQGSAADIIKLAMVRIAGEMRRRGLASTMIMQVHDELVFDVEPSEMAELSELIVREMEGAYHGRIPLEVSVGKGENWLEAH